MFLRPAAARAERRHARQRKRRGHDLQEMAAALAVFHHFARARRKFAVQPVLELRRVGQFVQAAPVTAAGCVRRIGQIIFHR